MVKQIGPNVSISANARIGAGVRLISCIILDDVEIKVYNQIKEYDMLTCILKFTLSLTFLLVGFQENAVIIHAIVGWKSSVGRWSRVQASLDFFFFLFSGYYDVFVG